MANSNDRYKRTATIASDAAPTTVDGTVGVPLAGLKSISVCVGAASGQTLSGAGTLMCYTLDLGGVSGSADVPSLWERCPAGDVDIAAYGASGMRFLRSEPFQVAGKKGTYVFWRCYTDVTVSGGTTVVLYHIGEHQSIEGVR